MGTKKNMLRDSTKILLGKDQMTFMSSVHYVSIMALKKTFISIIANPITTS